MKKITFLLITIFATASLPAQQPASKEQQVIQQAVVKLFEALSDRDSVSLKMHSTTDISLYEYGQVWNIDTLIRKAITMNQSADFKRTNIFEFLNTETSENMAWITYRLSSVIYRDAKESQVQWLETVVLVKQGKQWKVKHLHSTLLKRS
ncbi:MAG: nuclear transport factor 2 family protein [Ferruginibacter sp.]